MVDKCYKMIRSPLKNPHHDENTARQFGALSVGAKGHQVRVIMCVSVGWSCASKVKKRGSDTGDTTRTSSASPLLRARPARPRPKREGAIRATVPRTPSAPSFLLARRAVFPSEHCTVQIRSVTQPHALAAEKKNRPYIHAALPRAQQTMANGECSVRAADNYRRGFSLVKLASKQGAARRERIISEYSQYAPANNAASVEGEYGNWTVAAHKHNNDGLTIAHQPAASEFREAQMHSCCSFSPWVNTREYATLSTGDASTGKGGPSDIRLSQRRSRAKENTGGSRGGIKSRSSEQPASNMQMRARLGSEVNIEQREATPSHFASQYERPYFILSNRLARCSRTADVQASSQAHGRRRHATQRPETMYGADFFRPIILQQLRVGWTCAFVPTRTPNTDRKQAERLDAQLHILENYTGYSGRPGEIDIRQDAWTNRSRFISPTLRLGSAKTRLSGLLPTMTYSSQKLQVCGKNIEARLVQRTQARWRHRPVMCWNYYVRPRAPGNLLAIRHPDQLGSKQFCNYYACNDGICNIVYTIQDVAFHELVTAHFVGRSAEDGNHNTVNKIRMTTQRNQAKLREVISDTVQPDVTSDNQTLRLVSCRRRTEEINIARLPFNFRKGVAFFRRHNSVMDKGCTDEAGTTSYEYEQQTPFMLMKYCCKTPEGRITVREEWTHGHAPKQERWSRWLGIANQAKRRGRQSRRINAIPFIGMGLEKVGCLLVREDRLCEVNEWCYEMSRAAAGMYPGYQCPGLSGNDVNILSKITPEMQSAEGEGRTSPDRLIWYKQRQLAFVNRRALLVSLLCSRRIFPFVREGREKEAMRTSKHVTRGRVKKKETKLVHHLEKRRENINLNITLLMKGIWELLVTEGGGGSTIMLGRGKPENPEKTRQPLASSTTIPTCENPSVTRPEIEPGATVDSKDGHSSPSHLQYSHVGFLQLNHSTPTPPQEQSQSVREVDQVQGPRVGPRLYVPSVAIFKSAADPRSTSGGNNRSQIGGTHDNGGGKHDDGSRETIPSRSRRLRHTFRKHHEQKIGRCFSAGSLPDFRMWESNRTMPLDLLLYSGISRFPRPFIPALLYITSLHPHRLETSLLTAAQISSLIATHKANIGLASFLHEKAQLWSVVDGRRECRALRSAEMLRGTDCTRCISGGTRAGDAPGQLGAPSWPPSPLAGTLLADELRPRDGPQLLAISIRRRPSSISGRRRGAGRRPSRLASDPALTAPASLSRARSLFSLEDSSGLCAERGAVSEEIWATSPEPKSMKQRRNARAGETGDPRENQPNQRHRPLLPWRSFVTDNQALKSLRMQGKVMISHQENAELMQDHLPENSEEGEEEVHRMKRENYTVARHSAYFKFSFRKI
ncbi:hypothetical protein PR048_015050 [Dryococelus australis]|uniref:Uncharacterized protein n=1 Tax=Dryococelus australis TaxID=614101 RepID=A0ABQ9HG55_9NEOP|nr:hypothetical protein PR048_015050 [Dryococelus australis]